MAGLLVLVVPVVEGALWLGARWAAQRAAQRAAQALAAQAVRQGAAQTAREATRTAALPLSEACSNCGPPRDPCKTGPYDDLECDPGEHRHHIISDYVIRAGRRADTSMRLPGAPSLGEGPSICVSPETHRTIHRRMDHDVSQLGAGATLEDVKKIAMDVLEEVKPECASTMQDIRQQLDDAFANMNPNAPVRNSPRLPSPGESEQLMSGVGRARGGR